ncbi:hypothetical protein [Streptomyces sp. CAU 1734]|uniref:hypothetical protein n=1 Tax=Streptomyces sp. CAU 1734 TaxID=3140360 RepID=UPI00325FFB29
MKLGGRCALTRRPALRPAARAPGSPLRPIRNRARNIRGLQPGEETDDLAAYLGEHDIKVARHPAAPASVTDWLVRQFDDLAEAAPVPLLARAPRTSTSTNSPKSAPA